VDYRVIMGAKKTKYCGLNNIPPPFDTDNQISQWRAGFSVNRRCLYQSYKEPSDPTFSSSKSPVVPLSEYLEDGNSNKEDN
jgi:hypothetical protein